MLKCWWRLTKRRALKCNWTVIWLRWIKKDRWLSSGVVTIVLKREHSSSYILCLDSIHLLSLKRVVLEMPMVMSMLTFIVFSIRIIRIFGAWVIQLLYLLARQLLLFMNRLMSLKIIWWCKSIMINLVNSWLMMVILLVLFL